MVRIAQLRVQHSQVSFADLGSTVCRGWAPQEALERLPDLYHSCLAIPEYFQCRAPDEPFNACLLEDPEAVVCYRVRGLTARVLNRVFELSPETVVRLCRSLFRAHRAIVRVNIEVTFPPDALPLPHRVTLEGEDYVIDLPAAPTDYDAALGKTTRAHLRQYRNGLQRTFREVRFRDVRGADIDRSLVDLLIGWNIERCRQKGEKSTHERHPEEVGWLVAQLARFGEAKILLLDGRPAAGSLSQRVGEDVWIRVCSFDPVFARYHVGMVTLYTTIRSYAGSARRAHLMWGSPTHKLRLGAQRLSSWELSVYRSPAARALAVPEAARLGARQLWHCHPVASVRWHAGNLCREPGAYWSRATAPFRRRRDPRRACVHPSVTPKRQTVRRGRP